MDAKTRRRINEGRDKALVACYEAGSTVRDVAAAFHIGKSMAARIIRRAQLARGDATPGEPTRDLLERHRPEARRLRRE